MPMPVSDKKQTQNRQTLVFSIWFAEVIHFSGLKN